LNTRHDDTSGYNQDTIRIHHDTCILYASSEPRWIHTRYARDTQQIHQGYVSWARSICPAVQGARVSKDGNHYRILEHTTGYFYQQGFLPSATEEPDERRMLSLRTRQAAATAIKARRKTKKKRKYKKKKKSPHPRSRREARVLRHLTRQERQRKSRHRRRPSAHPSVAAISRARDTYP